MTGLIIKDFLFMKAQAKALSFLFIFFVFLSFVSQSTSYLLVMCSILAIPVSATLASYDDSVKWNRFACSLPYTRQQIVASRYISVTILTVLVAVFAFIISIIQMIIFKNASLEIATFTIIGSSAVAFISLSLVMPLFIKFGVEKARILMMIFLVIPSALVMIVDLKAATDFLNSLSKISPVLIIVAILAFIALCLYISYLVAVKIFTSKDL